jgi:AcrR family transcriptional regulator
MVTEIISLQIEKSWYDVQPNGWYRAETVNHMSSDSELANQRERILSATTQLMSQKGFKGTSLQEVADLVGCHKSILFHYFRNKEELVLAILEIGIGQAMINLESISEEKDVSPKQRLEKAICSHVESVAKYKDNVNIYHTESRFLSEKTQLKYLPMRERYAKLF